MKKYLAGLFLSLFASVSFAQSVITFDVQFTRVLEASGAFAPDLVEIADGPFNPGDPVTAPTLTGTVTLSAVPSSNQLTTAGLNQIVLNGSWSSKSGFSPSSGWSTHTYNNAVFDLYSQGAGTPGTPASYLATDFVSDPDFWPTFGGTAIDGLISDHGPQTTCPFFFGCLSANPALTFEEGTTVFDTGTSTAVYPTLADAGWHPLVSASSTYSQTNASSGLGHDNGLDGFYYEGVLDVANNSQILPGGIVRIVMTSETGNTWYVVEGTIVPVPAAAWLFGSALGLLAWMRRRIAA
jgi:hypothetical protein